MGPVVLDLFFFPSYFFNFTQRCNLFFQ
jgi:hypothetical protein